MTFTFFLVERIRRYRLSREGKTKADKKRQAVEEAFLKTTHLQRQEAAQVPENFKSLPIQVAGPPRGKDARTEATTDGRGGPGEAKTPRKAGDEARCEAEAAQDETAED